MYVKYDYNKHLYILFLNEIKKIGKVLNRKFSLFLIISTTEIWLIN